MCAQRSNEIYLPYLALSCSEPIARANGCAVVRAYTGHGVHELFHCLPNIPHYAKNKAVGTMKAGMVSSCAPSFSVITDILFMTRYLPLSRYESSSRVFPMTHFLFYFTRCSISELIGQRSIGQITGQLLP